MSDTIGLGIDVGGTNTDSVLIDLENKKILSFAKASTTRADLSIGIAESLRGFEQRHFPDIALVGLSTTLATNAIVEGARRRVLSILIGYGPDDVPYALREDAVLVRGGESLFMEKRLIARAVGSHRLARTREGPNLPRKRILRCPSETGQSVCCKSGRFPSYGQESQGSLDNDTENRYKPKYNLFDPASPQSSPEAPAGPMSVGRRTTVWGG